MYQCKWCSNQYESYNSIAKHAIRTHKINNRQLRIDYFHDGVVPLCKCGCGQETKLHTSGFMDYINGHNSKGNSNPMFGKHHSDTSKRNISTTRKKKFAKGEYRIWQNENTEETRNRWKHIGDKISANEIRAKKISNMLTGVPKSEEHKRKSKIGIIKAWKNQELRNKQAQNRISYFQSGNCNKVSNLENKFSELLVTNNITFKQQYYVDEIQSFYDFYIPRKDGTYFVVELHGNYWHCKPGTKFEIPKYAAQLKNIKNDEKKKLWCELNNVPLLVIWEDELDTSIDKLKSLL